ncbi:MAG: peptide deformylase [Mariprofundaceae bacterium]
MSVRKVLKMGDSRLLQRAQDVTDFSAPALQLLIDDMFDTMREYKGVGLAAPQIGESLRVVIFGSRENSRYPDAPDVPQTVLINPQITVLDATLINGWEGCLSLPGLRGEVPRFLRIAYRGLALDGSPIEREAEGFHARVVQHECDHLDGVLYPMRITDMCNFGFEDELEDKLAL